jgi:hypothetical protein
MTPTPERTDRPAPLPLAELFTRYLSRQAEAQSRGLAAAAAGEVEPYESVPAQPVEPRQAWADAVAAAEHLGAPRAEWPVPPEWPALVAAQEPAVAVPFCLGSFPQLVRDLQPLLAAADPGGPRPPRQTAPPPVGLAAWAGGQKTCPATLLAAGVLRLARQFEEAEAALGRAEDVPAAWRAVHANEAAALAWYRGRHAEALAAWAAQAASVPVLFNRGMASLFLGRPADARDPLGRAVAGLPETSAWHHLGRLYLTLASAR